MKNGFFKVLKRYPKDELVIDASRCYLIPSIREEFKEAYLSLISKCEKEGITNLIQGELDNVFDCLCKLSNLHVEIVYSIEDEKNSVENQR